MPLAFTIGHLRVQIDSDEAATVRISAAAESSTPEGQRARQQIGAILEQLRQEGCPHEALERPKFDPKEYRVDTILIAVNACADAA